MRTMYVAIGEVDRLYLARCCHLTVIVRPALMLLSDALAQGVELMQWDEMELARAASGPRVRRLEDYDDRFPTLSCPCTVPPSLRLEPWPACPAHHLDAPTGSVVEVAEWIARRGVGPIQLDAHGCTDLVQSDAARRGDVPR